MAMLTAYGMRPLIIVRATQNTEDGLTVEDFALRSDGQMLRKLVSFGGTKLNGGWRLSGIKVHNTDTITSGAFAQYIAEWYAFSKVEVK